MILALIIFILMYIGMLAFSRHRVWFALGAAAVMVAVGVLPIRHVPTAVNWNVLMMIAGTMGIVSLFIESGMPARLADLMLRRMPNACVAITMLAVLAGVVSAFVDNVATVLMVAPVGLAICKKLDINPIPTIIAIAVSSNLQGAATLVGDTTSILLGGYAGMDFLDFLFWRGRFSIFWAVELGALATVPVLLFLFRRHRSPVSADRLTEVTDYFPSVLMVAVVVLLIAASFIPNKWDITNGLICVGLCLVGIVRACLKRRNLSALRLVAGEMDLTTLGMLVGLFIVIAAVEEAGLIDAVAAWFAAIGAGSYFGLYTLLVFGSVVLSAFIDNIPYVAAMLPVVSGIGSHLGIDPVGLYFGLLIGATLGGNITPFGASANVTAIGILRRNGYEVKNRDFFRIGVPFTMTAVVIGYLFVWFVWC